MKQYVHDVPQRGFCQFSKPFSVLPLGNAPYTRSGNFDPGVCFVSFCIWIESVFKYQLLPECFFSLFSDNYLERRLSEKEKKGLGTRLV